MSSNFSTNTNFYDYNSLYGNPTDAYGGMASWGNTPATGAINTSQFMSPEMLANYAAPTNSLRDFNSQYGSTIMGGLQGAAGLWGAYNGMQQTKLAEQQMANSLNQWNKNYANQVASYNTRLEDRQNARYAAQGANQQDTASYMAKNSLK